MLPKEEYVYKLTDPFTMEVRYIGRTTEPLERLRAHIYQTAGGTDKDEWIIGLRARDTFPIMEVIEAVPFGTGAMREKHWIKYYFKQGANLFNKIHNKPELQVIGYKKKKSQQTILLDCLTAIFKYDMLPADKWTLLALIKSAHCEEAPQMYRLDVLASSIGVSVKGLYAILERLQARQLLTSKATQKGTIITTHIRLLLGEMEEGE